MYKKVYFEAITLASILTLNVRIVFGSSLIFVQFFGAFFGALLTKTALSQNEFMDSFIGLGIIKRNFDVSTINQQLIYSLNTSQQNDEKLLNVHLQQESLDIFFDNKYQVKLTSSYNIIYFSYNNLYIGLNILPKLKFFCK